jgi:hypothetical protein
MPKLSEIKPDTRLFAMFVGDSSGGKTCAELSLPTPGILFDIDMRVRGGLAAKKWLPPDVLDKWEVKMYPPKLGSMDKLFDDLTNITYQLDQGVCKYKSILVDSSTSIARNFIEDATNLTNPSDKSQLIKGKNFGTRVKIAGPGHYQYELSGMADILNLLRAMPINVILSGHIIPKYGKPPGDGNEYAENVVVGEQLALREKVATNVIIYFDEVYRFGKTEQNSGQNKHWVRFRDGDLARTSYDTLPNGKVDITGRSFYEYWKSTVNGDNQIADGIKS